MSVLSLFPMLAVSTCDVEDANGLLIEWGHALGPCRRPFHQEAHVMTLEQRPVAVTVSASTVSATCGGMERGELVELARIARAPDHPWVLRPMLRIWRAVLAPAWSGWPVAAAVSYALPGKTGDLYRFDGWERVGQVKPSAGGGTWSTTPKVNGVADGVKTLWRFRYSGSSAPDLELIPPPPTDADYPGGSS